MDVALKQFIQETMRERNVDADVQVKRLKKVTNSDFYLFQVTISVPQMNVTQDQFVLFNGNYITDDLMDVRTRSATTEQLLAEYLDTSKLSILAGTNGAKNVVVKITDFECPFCRKANEYIEKKLQARGSDDVVVYISHMPLNIHKKAELFARIFEAGLLVGKNFAHELFSDDKLLDMTDAQVISYFSKQADDSAKFRELLYSPGVDVKLEAGRSNARMLNIRSTPVLYINGVRIDGFDEVAIDEAFKRMK
ncbi:hypothetical protein AGMMS49941_12820 [Deferribacterales bacterium]|nr:hypothetical protein AGMMS49941_12820 [Deferribacterales bacterium]